MEHHKIVSIITVLVLFMYWYGDRNKETWIERTDYMSEGLMEYYRMGCFFIIFIFQMLNLIL